MTKEITFNLCNYNSRTSRIQHLNLHIHLGKMSGVSNESVEELIELREARYLI